MSVDIKDFKKQLESLIKETVKEITGRQNMSQLGKFITDDMRKRIRLGYGVRSNNGSKEKLKPLSDSYVQQRQGKLGFWTNSKGKKVPIITDKSIVGKTQATQNKRFLKQRNKPLHPTTRPKKSNLTRTGKLMRSIGFLYTDSRLIIGFKTPDSGRVAAFVSKDRPFFFMTNTEVKRATRFIQKRFKDLLNRNKRKYF